MSESSAHPYIPNTAPASRHALLEAVGATTVEEFYTDCPPSLRLDRPLALPAPFPAEADLARHLDELLGRNLSTRKCLSFLGAGTYNHHVPAVVEEVINRAEFLTAYGGEPYEDHGRFQALFEYQSLMGELLSMDVVNVPTYDGFQAAATSLAMARRITTRRTVVVASDVHPDKLAKVADYLSPHLDLHRVPTSNAVADVQAVTAAVDDNTAAVWIETPSFHGAIETALADLAAAAHARGALLVAGTEPLALGVLAPPATAGADIVCGDIQSLGIRQWFGGAHGGFIAVHDDPRFVMELPSRLFGLAGTAVPGEYGFGDVAFERTSFALREEGKEWVGTAAALWGIAAAVYLSLMGPRGMADIGETVLARTQYAMQQLTTLPGVVLTDAAIHFREFVIDVSGTGLNSADVIAAGRAQGIEPGVAVGSDLILVCVTELHRKADIDRLVRTIETAVLARSA